MKITQKWIYPPPLEIPPELKRGFGGSNFLLESLVRRGIKTPESAAAFLDYTKYTPQPPKALPGVVAAVTRILEAVAKHETIGVWGDFDVDGQTATAVLVDTLRKIGAELHFHIPIRSQESHGIKLSALQNFLTPDMKVLLTCDTGVSANDAAAYLKTVGVDLIITDHHQLPKTLPEALAIVNPQFLPEGHPLHDLAGVGAAYKLAEALLEKYSLEGETQKLHDLVALGSIADMAVLKGDTRFLVQSGLNRIRTAPRLFLSKMAELLDLPLDRLNEEHIGFYIAPRMNAVGRLDDANPMVNLLLSNDVTKVNITLNQMEALNANRRVLVSQVFEGCMAQLDSNPALLGQPLLILSHPEWPAGVIGIAAGRLAELTYRPVILFSGDLNGILRGSARSVAGIDITAALTRNQDLLLTFGGHPMAAGLSLKGDHLPEFRVRMQQTVAEMAVDHPVEPELQIETSLNLEQVKIDLLADLDRLAPFGAGNPPPIFTASGLTLEDTAVLGRNSEHLQAFVKDEQGVEYRILWWQGADLPLPEGKFDLAYTAHLNIYRGSPQIQYEWVDFHPSQDESVIRRRKTKRQMHLVDYRTSAEITPDILAELNLEHGLVWQEGATPNPPFGVDRIHLEKAQAVAILTIPPSSRVLLETVEKVKPATLFFLGNLPAENDLGFFLKEIGSTIKLVIKEKTDAISVSQWAAKMATTDECIRLAIEWYAAKGLVNLVQVVGDQIRITPGGKSDPRQAADLQTRLKFNAEEISAYRRYYMKASLESLMNLREY